MKIAKVNPVFKTGDKCVFTNYRPISLLPQFSKILEKLYNARLKICLNRYDLFCPSQYGFIYSIGVFIDLKKAFDTVDHDVLAKKHYFYGVRGTAHKWIVSYLENRSQFVQYKKCDSEVLKVCCGVPQGFILGPKLFIMFINDIFNASKVFKFILFADDTNMFYCNNDINERIRKKNAELDKPNVWFSVNRLSLNIAKTNYMIFGNRALKTSLSIRINKVTINRVEATNFLCVLIDDKLTWKHHISLLKSKLSKCCAVMYKTSFLIERGGMRILYYSLFSPYIMYCAEIWGNTYAPNLICLVLLQKRL